MDTIEERDGMLYVAMRDVLDAEPVEVVNLYPTGIRAYGCRHLVGRQVKFKNGAFWDDQGMRILLRDGPTTRPALTEKHPVPEPRQRGVKLDTRWFNGRWYKNTRNGWKPA